MIPVAKPVLEGVVQEDGFRRECDRLWRESAQAVGIDPLLITETIRRVAMDPWSSPSEFPRYVDKPATGAVPTPKILAQRINGNKENK